MGELGRVIGETRWRLRDGIMPASIRIWTPIGEKPLEGLDQKTNIFPLHL